MIIVLFTYIAQNTISSGIARTNEAIHSIDALSATTRLAGTIVDVDLAQLSSETGHALTCVSLRRHAVVH